MKTKLFMVIAGMFFLVTGCAQTSFFGVPSKAMFAPEEFGQTEAMVRKAEKSPGAQYCPDKIARARELGKEGIEIYWACRTVEALGLLAQSNKLAEEAMLCKAPPKPAPPAKPADSDGDGVYDNEDQCPSTPQGVKVDSTGCPLDTDGDGVYDYLDKCPGTHKGVKVDSTGCPLDTDGDGVYDNEDQCPNTPQGVKVDSTGCPLDTDGDGVYDYIDQCPDTPTAATVNERGCWVPKNVYFDTNRWNIKPQYSQILDEVVNVLRRNANQKVEIHGHTDSRGSAKYNQGLSENRAKSVMDYLIKEGVGSDRLTDKGYGLTKPAFPNDSPENMAKNRRAELKPIR